LKSTVRSILPPGSSPTKLNNSSSQSPEEVKTASLLARYTVFYLRNKNVVERVINQESIGLFPQEGYCPSLKREE